MATRNRKSQPVQEVTSIEQALDTPVERTLEDAADYLGVAPIRLQEMFCDRLSSNEPMAWFTIPLEHEPLLEAFKRELDAENSVRRLDTSSEPTAELPPMVEEISELPEELPRKKRDGKGKKDSTALTKRQKEAMQKKEQQAGNLSQSVTEVKRTIKRQKGTKSGAELAAIELAAEDLTYHAIKDQALRREIAIHGVEMAQHANFDPIKYLQESGLIGEGDLLDNLKADASDLLGKYEIATQEIIDNSTLNGFNLEDSEALLNELLNSKESA